MPKIPLFSTPDTAIVDTTQNHLPIAAIEGDVVMLKDGGAAIVLESTSLNFGLLSDREQEAVIASYAALINSLSFHIQIVVRSQKKDISHYLRYLDENLEKVQNPKLKMLMEHYRAFIRETITKRKVLGKRFLIVIPFAASELGVKSSMRASFTGKNKALPYTKDYILKKAKIALYPKRDHMIRQAARLGLRLKALTADELVTLYHDIYNPNIDTVRETKEDPLAD